MTREIKFRAWDAERKTMHYQDKAKWMLSCRGVNPGNEFELHGAQSINNFFIPEMGALMQFTGIKDKNGREIYESDIVRILYTDWPSNPAPNNEGLDEYKESISQYGEVVFSNTFGNAEYELCNQDWRGSISPGRHGEIEVIGNIYENPERS